MPNFTLNGIDFKEVGEWSSPFPAVGNENSRAEVRYRVRWQDAMNAATALLGTTKCFTGGVSNIPYLRRTQPHRWPTMPWLIATDVVRIEPDGTPLGNDALGVAQYSDAKLTVLYSGVLYGTLDDTQMPQRDGVVDEGSLQRYVIRRTEDRERSLTYRDGSFVWLDRDITFTTGGVTKTFPAPVASPVGRTWPITRITYQWLRVPQANAPRARILAAVGHTNNLTFDGCDEGTLLIRAPRFDPCLMPGGTLGFNITIVADHNPFGWSSLPDPERPDYSFHPVGRKAGSVTIARLYPQDAFMPDFFRPITAP